MDIEIFTQPTLSNGENFTLGDEIVRLLDSGEFKDVSFYLGIIKEDVYEKLFPHFKNFILTGGMLSFYLDFDKRRSLKKIAKSMLELGCDIFLRKESQGLPEFQYKTAIFENSKNATALFFSGNFTMSGLYEGMNTTLSLQYSLRGKGKEEFLQLKDTILFNNVLCTFEKLSLQNIDTFFSENAVLSIEEFTHKDIVSQSNIDTNLNDISIDIEIDDNVDFLKAPTEPVKKVEKSAKSEKELPKVESVVEENPTKYEPVLDFSEEEPKYYMDNDAIDIETMLFQSYHENTVKPEVVTVKENPHYHDDLPEEEHEAETTIQDSKIITKTASLTNTSIFMFQAPKITKKGVNAGEVKIPTYLRDLIPQFWGWPKDYKIDKTNSEKYQNCILKIVDTQNPNDILTDNNAKLFQREGENSFNVYSKVLSEMNINENDILRFIKTQSENGYYFCCEIVRQEAKEYPIWDQFCTTALKSSKRRYGMM